MQYIAVVGPGADATDDDLRDAFEIGRELAARDVVVVTGGLDGVMAEAARGCSRGGGTSIGLLPGTDRAAANPHLTLALPTGLGEARNAVLVGSVDAVIAVGGSWGTLSEIALARRAGKPVVCVRGWSVPGLEQVGAAAAVDRIVALLAR